MVFPQRALSRSTLSGLVGGQTDVKPLPVGAFRRVILPTGGTDLGRKKLGPLNNSTRPLEMSIYDDQESYVLYSHYSGICLLPKG